MNIKIQLPAIFAIDKRLDKNSIQQLIQPKSELDVVAKHYQKNRVKGYVLTPTDDSKERIFAIYNQAKPPEEFNKVLRIKPDDLVEDNSESVDLSGCKWIQHPDLTEVPEEPINYEKRLIEVLDSWQCAFSYKVEEPEKKIDGLRPPQIGAVHATHAHWTVTDEPATIVMPTGTGKTETMLSIFISKQCEKLLVVVPTDALRTQISDKFLTLGLLKDFGIVSDKGLYPIVGILNHKPKECDDVDSFFEKCNVIVTTMSIAGQCLSDIRDRMAHQCPFLFIDEAHHSPAKTWQNLKESFREKIVLQFTATPFRNDGKLIDGKIIFKYPLSKAQDEGYFKTIHFKPVKEYDPLKVDQAIAEKAVKQLRNDLKKHDHIIMARVGNIKKAEKVFSIYRQYAEFNPVIVHSRMKLNERNEIREKLIRRESKLVVCVDMFGEGFDLPEMKIAALHDIRKSLTVTLQLAGRFTRTGEDLGDATFISNIADIRVQEKLTKLYYQNADWNVLLKDASEETIQEKIDLQELVDGFHNNLTDMSLKNIRPAMSTVIYKTECENWKPENFMKGIYNPESFNHIDHTINIQESTLVIVTGKKIPVDWAQSIDIFNWDWELYVLFWDKKQNLLFIHSSDKNSYFEKLAKAVAGEVELIKGAPVFRCLSGINRLKLQNVGLIHQVGRLIRYIMRAGADIEPGLTQTQREQATKSNIFGTGYENGDKTSIGCSYKGRIWSRCKTNLETLRQWCSAVGSKVLNDKIDPDQILEGTLVSEDIPQIPQQMPFAIDWPEKVYTEPETTFTLVTKTEKLPFFKTDIKLLYPTYKGNLKFEICSDNTRIKLDLTLSAGDFEFTIVGNQSVSVEWRKNSQSLKSFFYNNPPIIYFVDGSSLEGNMYTKSKKHFDSYQREKIVVWNWKGVDIKKEPQGRTKEVDSVQYRVIRELEKNNYNIIFDDHDTGEVADVVCISVDEKISVEFYHCKASQTLIPGSRIADLPELCSQAQRNIHWIEKENFELFDHMLRREALRKDQKEVSRFERGNMDELWKIKEMSRDIPVEHEIFIVQPGLSKSKASHSQLRLLGVTENYLMETCQIPFGIIANDTSDK